MLVDNENQVIIEGMSLFRTRSGDVYDTEFSSPQSTLKLLHRNVGDILDPLF